jgi:pimeloyl-ACP methyl ester carboxylesterase
MSTANDELDRHDRANGKTAGTLPVVDQDPAKASALPTPDSWTFFEAWRQKSAWKNEVTVRSCVSHSSNQPFLLTAQHDSIEHLRSYDPSAMIHRISPTPLLLTVAENDVLTPTDLALEAYAKAWEPKQLSILPGGHFDAYAGANFEKSTKVQVEFLRRYLCS